jgi:hypothetical protein
VQPFQFGEDILVSFLRCIDDHDFLVTLLNLIGNSGMLATQGFRGSAKNRLKYPLRKALMAFCPFYYQ